MRSSLRDEGQGPERKSEGAEVLLNEADLLHTVEAAQVIDWEKHQEES